MAAKEAVEAPQPSTHRLPHFEHSSGALQITTVLASAWIITCITLLARGRRMNASRP